MKTFRIFRAAADSELKAVHTFRNALLTFGSIFSLYYFIFRDPVIFHWGYGSCITSASLINFYWCQKLKNMTLSDKNRTRAKMFKLCAMKSAISFLFGFILWNVDYRCCDQVTWLKNALKPFGISDLAELHAWWHLITALSGTWYMHGAVVLLQIRSEKGEFENIEVRSCLRGTIPVIFNLDKVK